MSVYFTISLYISLLYLFLHFVLKNKFGSVVLEQIALGRFLQCMSPTRSEYRNLGIELVSLKENRSSMSNKPSMEEEKGIDEA
jgi:hypothetical protein